MDGAVAKTRIALARLRALGARLAGTGGRPIPPVRQFAVLSAAVLLLTGAAQAWVLGREIESQIITQSAETLAADVGTRMRREVGSADLEGPFEGQRYDAFADFLRSSVLSDRVHRVKLWNMRKQVVYSDDRSILGRTFAEQDELEELFRESRVVVGLDEATSENVGEQGYGRLVEIYVPLVPRDSDAIRGAYEVYLDYEPIATQVWRAQLAIWITAIAALAALWLALFGVFLRASRDVRHGEEARQRAGQLHDQVRRDPLTGLPNRVQLEERLEDELAVADRQVALLMIDLDKFKEVNDGLGHEAGDELLRQIAPRFLRQVRHHDLVARLGGDEFALLLPGADVPVATAIARDLLVALAEPFSIEGEEVTTLASIGIAVGSRGVDGATLRSRADAAMYEAKRRGRGTYVVYEPASGADAHGRVELANDLSHAIDAGQLGIEYQPILRLATGEVDAVEALARWDHPRLGRVAPSDFVPLAERTGLIRALTRRVLGTVMDDRGRWQWGTHVYVNVSLRDLLDAELRQSIAGSCGGPGQCITLELSAQSSVTREGRLADAVSRLRAAGARLAVKDFGAGRWSFTDLWEVPADVIKVDKQLVAGVASDAAAAAMFTAIVAVAHSAGREVVAEGVDDDAVLGWLRGAGCDLVQGLCIAPPMSAEVLTVWLSARPGAGDTLDHPRSLSSDRRVA